MKKYLSLVGLGIILLTLNACHQKPVKSVVTPITAPVQHQFPSLELLTLSESAHNGWSEVELIGRKWYVDSDTALTRSELNSLSLGQNDKKEMFLNIIPNQQGQRKINEALRKKVDYVLLVLNGQAISLSKINSSQKLPFYVGDENTTIKVAEEITQKKITHQ